MRRRYRESLRLDRQSKRVGGVCAGFANYMGWSHSTFRIFTLIGLFIAPQMVLPAYALAYFVLDDDRRLSDAYYD